jgi:hypothetical protein
MNARILSGGRYEKIASDLTPSTVLTTFWNKCWISAPIFTFKFPSVCPKARTEGYPEDSPRLEHSH